MQDLNIPGLGTFSAHVVIDGQKYEEPAHGQVGGHLEDFEDLIRNNLTMESKLWFTHISH